ncbi:MAG: GDSL-type esterase/lipase family protein [Chitinophagaceae bacterium]|jgi:lysophospholipase L1-like esterase|nr:GDSL-type esterase/lipase family protein [Chitinophagaceae bacterium]
MSRHLNSLLCLGDSYTIGEGVPLYEGFPYQVAQILRKQHIPFHAPEVVAKTGWTTFELADYLINHSFNEHYDFVTLLIGVNNQYRGLDLGDYAEEFEFLLRKAIHFAGGNAARVCVLSIPDWGVTPFAADRDAKVIAAAIDSFNEINASLAQKYGAHFEAITAGTREAAADASLLAADGLHYSAREYGRWAARLAEWIKASL